MHKEDHSWSQNYWISSVKHGPIHLVCR